MDDSLEPEDLLNALLRDSPAPPETESSNNAAAPDEPGSAITSPEEFQPDPEAGLEVAGPLEVTPDVPGATPAPAGLLLRLRRLRARGGGRQLPLHGPATGLGRALPLVKAEYSARPPIHT